MYEMESVRNFVTSAHHSQPILLYSSEIMNYFSNNISVIDSNTGKSHSYKILEKDSDLLGRYLVYKFSSETNQKVEVHTGNLIGILSEKGYTQVVSTLSIMKSGHGYLPLSVDWPVNRIDEVLQQGKVRYLLISAQQYAQLPLRDELSERYELIVIEDLLLQLRSEVKLYSQLSKLALPEVQPDDIAYVIFTSGSTGKPKGVTVSHRSALNTIIAVNNRFNVNAHDKILALSELSFDLSVYDIYGLLLVGGTIVFPKQSGTKDTFHWIDLIERHGITLWNTVPQLADLLADEFEYLNKKHNDLRLFLLSGDRIPMTLPDRLKMSCPKTTVMSLGGATEGSIWSIWYEIHKIDPEWMTIPYGMAMPNQEMYVLTEAGEHSPVGVAGEIHIGGIGVALNYWNDEDRTKESYFKHPSLGRLYRTGDLGQSSAEGHIEFIGRKDNQVKIRGYRVELGEIEAQSCKYPDIKSAVVIEKVEGNGELLTKCLVLYFVVLENVSRDEEGTLPSKLRQFLEARLPHYMVPDFIIQLSELPLTSNGKVDRKALQIRDVMNHDNYEPPKNELEKNLCYLWSDILGLDENKISIHDEFFRLGGDSISTIRLISRIRNEYSCEINVKDVFELKTIERLARYIQQAIREVSLATKNEQGILTGKFELLPVQKWFFKNEFSQLSHYNQIFFVKVPELDIQHLKNCIYKLIHHHDAFRLRFIPINDGRTVYQQQYDVMTEEKFGFFTLDVSKLSSEALSQQLLQYENKIDIINGPSYSIGYLYGYSDKSARIYFAVHHLCIDTVSWRVLAENLEQLYNNITLSRKGSSYRQWVNSVGEYAKFNLSQKEYWSNILSDYSDESILKLKANKDKLIKCEFYFDEKETETLLQVSNRAYHTEINDLLLTALTYALSEIQDKNVHHISLEGHGREPIDPMIDINNTMGWFTTLFPVRLTLGNDISSSIIMIKEILRSIPNKGLGYGALMGYEKHALPRVSFNYLGQFDGSKTVNANNRWVITNEGKVLSSNSNNDQYFIATVTGVVIGGRALFRIESQLDESQTEKLLKSFEHHLRIIIQHTSDQKNSHLTTSDVEHLISSDSLNEIQQFNQVKAVYLANSLQQGFIYHALAQGQTDDAYRVQFCWEYNTNIDKDILKRAWEIMLKRYDALRLRFSWQDLLLQIIDENVELDWRYIDLSTHSQEDQQIELTKLRADDRNEAYQLQNGKLFRVYLIKLNSNKYSCLFSNHHAILDGWSCMIILNELHTVYTDIISGKPVSSHMDYSYNDAQRYIQKHQNDHDLYWKKQLVKYNSQNGLSRLVSKLDGEAIDTKIYKHNKVSKTKLHAITGEIFGRLKQLCRDNDFTLNALLNFVWHQILHIYTSDEQTIVGITVSGRNLPITDIEHSVGLYINTLPLMIDHSKFDNSVSIIDVIHSIQLQINEINAACVTKLSTLQRDGRRLFDCLFAYNNFSVNIDKATKENLKLTTALPIEKLDYPLALNIDEESERLGLMIKYAGELFDDNLIDGFFDTIQYLLTQVLQEPNRKLSSLSYCPNESFSTTEYSEYETIQSSFEKCVKQFPDEIALEYEARQFTYQELNEHSNCLAHYLVNVHKVKSETLIFLCTDNAVNRTIAMIGILKAGCAYVPISESVPDERLSYLLKDTHASLILTTESQRARFSRLVSNEIFVLVLDNTETKNNILKQSNNNPAVEITHQNLAYVMYTSGTTGEPKGVLVEHQGVVSLVRNVNYININNTDTFIQLSDVGFDASTFEIWGALLNGARLLLVKDRTSLLSDVIQFQTLLEQKKVSILWLTKSLFDQMYGLCENLFKNLKYLIVGGEALNKTLMVKLLSSSNHPAHVLNGYGPTENTTFSCIYELDLAEINQYETVPIGRAFSYRQAYVLTEALQPVPVGAIGELYVGGTGLARGYLNRETLTKERFVKNPFQTKSDLYKTGDWVRRLGNNNLLYLGRKDRQAKIRGYRVELEEIENIIFSFPDIFNCIVLIKENTNGHQQLIAYYQSNKGLNEEVLRANMAKRCPDYMVPSVFVRLDNFPLTTNGKIDKLALPKPDTILTQIPVIQHNKIQEKIQQIWSSILGLDVDKISINDNFFSIGGDSILCIQLVSKLKQTFEKNIRLNDIFRLNTIYALSEYYVATENKEIKSVDTKQTTQLDDMQNKIQKIWSSILGLEINKISINDNFFSIGGDSILCIQLVSKLKQTFEKNIRLNDIFRLNTITALSGYFAETENKSNRSINQKCPNEIISGEVNLLPIQSWFFSKNLSNLNYWNQSFLVKTPLLDIDRLRECVEKLTKHHDAFRLRYKKATDNSAGYAQYYANYDEKTEFSVLTYPGNEQDLDNYFTQWQSNFDITNGPLYRIGYVHGFPDSSARIYMAFHHLIIDTVSWRILVEDLENLYNGLPSNLKGSNYQQWVSSVNEYGKTHSDERQYWTDILSNYNERLLTDKLSDFGTVYESECRLDSFETDRLLRLSNEAYHTKINDLLLSALAYSLAELTGSQINHIVLEGHGREDIDVSIDTSHTVGWFTTMYPVRLEIGDSPSMTIKKIKENLRKIPNNGIGYGTLIGYDKTDLPKIGFNYLGQLDNQNNNSWKITSERAGRFYDEINNLPLDIDINGFVFDKKLFFSINTKLRSPFKEMFYTSFEQNLLNIIEHCCNKEFTEYTESDFSHIESEKDIKKLPVITTKNDYDWFEMTEIQKAYLLGRLANYEIGNISNHIYHEFYYETLDVNKLSKAISQLIRYYPVLRTVYSFELLKQKFLRLEDINPYEIFQANYRDINLNETDINQLRQKLSHKVYDPGKFPLFDFNVTHFKDCSVLHVSIDLILLDAESRRMLFSLLNRLYNDDEAALEIPSTTFKQYQEYYQMLRRSTWYKRDKAYWANKIPNMPLRPEMPLLTSPQNVNQPIFTDHTLFIPEVTWTKFKEKLVAHDVSCASALLALYGAVIAFHSGYKEFLITMTLFNRYPLCDDLNQILGDFTSTNLFHFTNFGKEVHKTIENTHQFLWEDINHALYTGIEAQRDLVKIHDLDENKAVSPIVFTGVFGNKNQSKEDIFLDGTEIKNKRFWCGQTSQAWIDLQAIETDNQLMSKWIYVDQLFDKNYIAELNALFCNLINHVAEGQWGVTTNLFTLPEKQKKFISAINSKKQDIPETTIFSAIDSYIKTHKLNSKIAVIDSDTNRSHSYTIVKEESDILARYLINKSSETNQKIERYTGNLIGILSEKGYTQIVSTLSIMKSGHGYLPLSVDWPVNRIDEVLQQGKVHYLLISAQQYAQLPLRNELSERYELIVVEDLLLQLRSDEKLYSQLSKTALPEVHPDDIAYVIFTSGSTGKPKGVTISHRSALNTIIAVNNRFNMNAHDKILALSELSFDLSVYDIFGLLLVGGTIVFPKQSHTKDPFHWIDLIERHGITVWNTVPQLADILADELEHTNKTQNTLRLFLLSGDKIPLTLADRLKAICPKATTMSLGGATEGSIWSIWYEIEKIDSEWKTIPYGVAMPNQEMYVLTEEQEHCPVGVVGEIHIGGMGVALNYWDDEDRTKESYFVHQNLGRLYRTGDLGKWHEAGYIEFIGRKDNQVKIRGYRVELGEIEQKLNSISGVKQGVVNIVGSTELTKMIVAYVVPEFDVDNQNNAENEELVRFKLAQHGDRILDTHHKINSLIKPFKDIVESKAYQRKSYRQFTNKKLFFSNIENIFSRKRDNNSILTTNLLFDHETLSEMLSVFYGHQKDTGGLPKYCYPSAGNLYPVQVYIRMNTHIVSGIISVYYYYDRRAHSLVLLSTSEARAEPIEVYYVAKPSAIEPIYREKSINFYSLETGYMHALLNESSEKYSVAWDLSTECPNEIKTYLKLDTKDSILLASSSPTSTLRTMIDCDVDCYLYIKPGSIGNFTGKWYQDKAGQLIEKEWPMLRDMDHLNDNAFIWNQSSFAIYFVSKSQQTDQNSLIQSGYVAQQLMDKMLQYSLGACPIGEIDGSHTSLLNALFEGREVLHHLVCGTISHEQMTDKNLSTINRADSFKKIVINNLNQHLPDYMMPAEIVLFEKFPLSANGKIDLKKLLLLTSENNENVINQYVSPRTNIENIIAHVWAEILEIAVDKISIKDSFFRLGGNSLLAMQLVSRLNNKLNIELQLKDIYELGNIEKISEHCNVVPVYEQERESGQL